MLTLVNILIAFFLFLIIYQIILACKNVEGFDNEYQSYDMNNPNNALILAQQNAGNISYLKQKIDNLQDIYGQVQDMSGNIQILQTQIDGLLQSQQDYADQMTGGSPPDISGATETEDD